MPAALVIAGKDLRQRLRDRSALVIGVLAPLVIAAIMSLAFRGAEQFHFALGVVDGDHGPVAAGMLQALRAPGLRSVVRVVPEGDATAAAAAVRDRTVAAALVIPPGFSASVAGTAPLALGTLTSVNQPTAGSVTAAVAASFVAQLNADRLSVATAMAGGAPAPERGALEQAAAGLQVPERLVQRPLGAHAVTAVSYYSPAMAIFFLLFTVSFTARSFFVDRAQGMVERMRAAPIRPLDILAGKALSVFVFGAASLTVIAVVTTLVFGASWGPVAAVVPVGAAMVVAVVCLTALVIGLARTQRQAEGIAGAVVFGLALIGGNFVFVSAMPAVMRRLALATPNGWALRAITDLSTGAGAGAAVVPVVAMLAFSAAVAVLAALLARRAVTA